MEYDPPAMMKEHRGQVVQVHRPPPKVRHSVKLTTTLPRTGEVSVRLDNGQTLRGLPEPAGKRLMEGDRVTLHADLTPGGTIGTIQKDGG